MLHPFKPFITEELWHAQGKRKYDLILAKWPNPRAEVSKDATDPVNWMIEFTTNARAARNELGIAPGTRMRAVIQNPSSVAMKVFTGNGAAAIERLSRVGPFVMCGNIDGAEVPLIAPKPAMEIAVGDDVLLVDLEGVIDVAAEKDRLEKALAASSKEVMSLNARLGNANFVERAKPEAVEKARADHAHHAAEVDRLRAALERLG